ncbi:MAG TPA: hypothetical protein EYN67_08595 [Flavobacteriales bacterium]|nr:hypothetical protein [Flavobacteriales bacterium]
MAVFTTNVVIPADGSRSMSSRVLGQKFTVAQLDCYQLNTVRCYTKPTTEATALECFVQIPDGTITQLGDSMPVSATVNEYITFTGTVIVDNQDFIIWIYQDSAGEAKLIDNCTTAGTFLGTEVEQTKSLTPIYANWATLNGECTNTALFLDGTYDATVPGATGGRFPPPPAYVRI